MLFLVSPFYYTPKNDFFLNTEEIVVNASI